MYNAAYAIRPESFCPSPTFARKSNERGWYSVMDYEEIQISATASEDILILTQCSRSPGMAALTPVMAIPTAWRFQNLVKEWRRERGVTSSPVQMAMCASYQRIMTMGEAVIPLILRELESEGDDPDHWFWALRFLADVDPIQPAERGNMKAMAAAWLTWGRLNGFKW